MTVRKRSQSSHMRHGLRAHVGTKRRRRRRARWAAALTMMALGLVFVLQPVIWPRATLMRGKFSQPTASPPSLVLHVVQIMIGASLLAGGIGVVLSLRREPELGRDR